MSGSVDNKVVKMTFDNAQFQRNVSDTMSALDRLKKSLSFEGAKDGFKGLSGSVKNVDLSPISTQIEGVNAKFLAMATIATAALAGIATQAASTGAQMIKSLTLDPVIDGYKEYETNIDSIQTILANTKSKGTTLDDVNSALDEMNEYSDKTIYNFAQMAKNVSKFTAAGVDLDTSVSAIKGLANVAALSGVKNEEAQRTMFQLSQAIGSGTVKLRDWISVENSSMSSEGFRDALFETGKAMGTITNVPIGATMKEWTDKTGSFRDTLESGWLTSEVLTTALGALAGDLDAVALSEAGFTDEQVVKMVELGQTALASATDVKTATQLFSTLKETIASGWSASFRTIVGDFIEAKGLFTNLNNFIGGFINRSSEARNKMLAEWKWFGGRQELMGGLMASLGAVQSILKPIGAAFREAFPKKTSEDLFNMTKAFREFAEKLILSENGAKRVKQIFTGVFSVMRIGWEVVKGLTSVFFNIVGVFGKIVGSFGGAAGSAGDFIAKIREILVDGNGIANFFGMINGAISKFGESIMWVRERLSGLFDFGGGKGKKGGGDPSTFSKVVDDIREIFEKLGKTASNIGDKLKDIFGSIGGFFSSIGGGLSDAGNAFGDWIAGIVEKINNALTSDAFYPALAALAVGIFGGIGLAIRKLLKGPDKLFESLTDMVKEIGKGVTGVLDGVQGSLKTFQNNIRADTLMKIAIAMGVLTVSLIVLSTIDPGKLGTALAAVAVGIGSLVAALAVLAKVEANPFKMAGLAISLSLVAAAAAMLALAVKGFASMSWMDLIKGLFGTVIALDLMVRAASAFSKNSGTFLTTGISLIILSGALWVFSKAIEGFSKMPWGTALKGLFIIGIIMSGLAVFVNIVDDRDLVRMGIGLSLVGASFWLLKKVIDNFAQIPFRDLVQGLFGLAAVLYIVIQAVTSMPNKEDMQDSGVGLLLMSGALWIMSKAVENLARIGLFDMIKSLGAIVIMMNLLVGAAQGMTYAQPGAVAMVVVAGALWVLAEVLEKVGSLSLGTILKGLLGLAGVLVILGIAAVALAAFPPVLAALNAMGVALILIGVGFAAFGAGIWLAASGLEKLANVGKDAGPKLVDALSSIAEAVPAMARAFAEAFVEFIKVVAEKAGEVMDAVGELVMKALDKIIELAPKFGEAASIVIGVILDILEAHGPRMIEVGMALLLEFLRGIRDNAEELATMGLEILTNFINGITAGIPNLAASITLMVQTFTQEFVNNYPIIMAAGVEMLVTFLKGIAAALPHIVGAVGLVVTTLIEELGKLGGNIAEAGVNALAQFLFGILGALPGVVTTAREMVTTLIDTVAEEAGKLVDEGIDAAITFLDGLVDSSIGFVNKSAKLVLKLLEGIESAIRLYSPRFNRAAIGIADAIIDGITGGLSNKVGEVISSVRNLVGNVLDTFTGKEGIDSGSPSKVFIRYGHYIGDGLILGLRANETGVTKATKRLASSTVAAFGQAMSGLDYDLQNMDEFNPTITPVLDLTRVSADARNLNGLLGSTPITASLSSQQARYLSAAQENANATQDVATTTAPTQLQFIQNNYSPEALSRDDIYRGTRSQLALAKEELDIP